MDGLEGACSTVDEEATEDSLRQMLTDDAPLVLEDGPDERTVEIDEQIAQDQAAAERSGKGQGMHSMMRKHAKVGPSGPKAVLADKRAHDLDKDIERRRGRAELAYSITSSAYGTRFEATPSVSWASTGRDTAAAVMETTAGVEDGEDEELVALRRRRLEQLRQAAAVPAGRVETFSSKADMGDALAADRDELSVGRSPRWRVVHLREEWHAGCRAVDVALRGVAGLCAAAGERGRLPAPVSVCAIRSGEAIRGYEPEALPTLAVYRGGANASQLVAVLGGEDAADRATVGAVAALLRAAGVPVPEEAAAADVAGGAAARTCAVAAPESALAAGTTPQLGRCGDEEEGTDL